MKEEYEKTTWWFHPESDSYFFLVTEPDEETAMQCVELTEEEYLEGLLKKGETNEF